MKQEYYYDLQNYIQNLHNAASFPEAQLWVLT